MLFATTMQDGSVRVTLLAPRAIVFAAEPAVELSIAGIATLPASDGEGEAVWLRLPQGLFETPVDDSRDLTPNSVPGAALLFPDIEEVVAKWPPADRNAVATHRAMEAGELPADRVFRSAWQDAGGQLTVDMAAARAIHRDRMRRARAPLLAALDVAYQRADEAGEPVARAEVVAAKQALRDVTALPEIAAAATPEALASVWPGILGSV